MTVSRLSEAAVMKVCTESGVPVGVGRMSPSSFLVLWDSVMYAVGGVSLVYLEFWEVLIEKCLQCRCVWLMWGVSHLYFDRL